MGDIRHTMALELDQNLLHNGSVFCNSNGSKTPSEVIALDQPKEETPSVEILNSNIHNKSNNKSNTTVTDLEVSKSNVGCVTGKVCSWNSLQSSLQSVFPNDENYTYVIESYKELQQENFIGAPDYAFEVQVRINISSEEGAKQWLSKFFSHSYCTYRHTRGVTNKVKCKRVLYKAFMHCQHQQKTLTPKQAERPKKCSAKRPLLQSVRKKKTSCPSALKITVTIPTKKDKRRAILKPELISHATTLTLLHSHNHPINSVHALTFRLIGSDAIEVYYQLFSSGHSASSTRHTYETRLMIEEENDDVMQQLADCVINPNPQDVS